MHSEPHSAEYPETSVWAGLLNAPDKCLPLPGGHPPMRFRWIPPGDFVMGSRGLSEAEEPRHRVVIPSGFWLGKFMVRKSEWVAICEDYRANMDQGVSDFHRAKISDEQHPGKLIDEQSLWFDDDPSLWPDEDPNSHQDCWVSWNAAQALCTKLEAFWGSQGLHKYRVGLPSEAQWEYAARAGTQRILSYRNGACNPAGLYEMGTGIGGAEWCADEFEMAYRQRPNGWKADKPWATSAPRSSTERTRVIRGYLGCTYRCGYPEDFVDESVGFRVCVQRDPSCNAASSDAEDSSWEDAKLPAAPSSSSAFGVRSAACSRQREQA